jgi:hypothetical protein
MPVSPGSYVLDYEQLTLKCLISVLKSPVLWSKIFIFFTSRSKISLQSPMKYCNISTVQDARIRVEAYKTPFLGEKGTRVRKKDTTLTSKGTGNPFWVVIVV